MPAASGAVLEAACQDCWGASLVQAACDEALLWPRQRPCPYPTVAGVCAASEQWAHSDFLISLLRPMFQGLCVPKRSPHNRVWAFHALGAWLPTSLASQLHQFGQDTFKSVAVRFVALKRKRSQIKKPKKDTTRKERSGAALNDPGTSD